MDPLVLFAVVFVGVGLLSVILHRWSVARRGKRATDVSMTRPVLAVLLVGSLVVLTAYALTADGVDPKAKDLLVGAVISLSSAAAAFYFASSHASEARHDLLSATTGQGRAPDLISMQVRQARRLMSSSDFALQLDPPSAAETDLVVRQVPPPGVQVPHHTLITATTSPPTKG